MVSHTIIHTFKETTREGGQNTVKKLMVVVLTIKEMSYLVVGIFNDMVGLFCVNICDKKFFDYTVCFNSSIIKKGPSLFPKSYKLFQ